MAQVYLMLDAAEYNAPLPPEDDEKNSSSPYVPDAPNFREKPVDFLEWQLRHSPIANAQTRLSEDQIVAKCAKFRAEIERGEWVWDEAERNWIRANEPAC